jgi:hypothetical protein
MFWIISLGGGHYARVPKGEVGIIFGTTTEMILENLDKDRESKKTLDKMAVNIIKELSPIGNLGEIMPTAFRPIIEVAFNKNFFTGRPIVGRRHEGLLPEYQYEPFTSETAKAIGGKLGVSPLKVENLTRGYLGGSSNYIFKAGDDILGEMGIIPKAKEMPPSLQRKPIVKVFAVNDPTGFNSETVNKFYEALGDITTFKKTYDKLNKQGQAEELKKLTKKDGFHYKVLQYGLHKEFNKASDKLSDYRKRRIGIIESSLSIDKKEDALDKIDALILKEVVPIMARYRGLKSWLNKGD